MRIGPFWSERPPVEIDAVVLAGRQEQAILAGEAKWSRTLDAARTVHELQTKSAALPRPAPDLRYAVCARQRLSRVPPGTLAVTAANIFV